MSNWKYTNIQHAARKKMGLSPNEYCVFDIIYQSQTNPIYSVNGWAKNPYSKLAEFLGFSKGAVFGIIERGVNAGFIEVNPADSKLKRTTEKWYGTAYLDEGKISNRSESERSESERKNSKTVQKVNENRSESERHINKYKTKSSLKEKEANEFAEVSEQELKDKSDKFSKVPDLKKRIGPKQYNALNDLARDDKSYKRLRSLFAAEKFWLLVEWLEYRKSRRNHMTVPGLKKLLNTLEEYTPAEIKIGIDKAIESNYLGLHPKKLPSKRKEARQAAESNLAAIFTPKPAMA